MITDKPVFMYATYREQWTYESGLMLQANKATPCRDQQVGTTRQTFCILVPVLVRCRVKDTSVKALYVVQTLLTNVSGYRTCQYNPCICSKEMSAHQIIWSSRLFRLSHSFIFFWFYFVSLYMVVCFVCFCLIL
jgi:hypothetical protein